jgi:hypothetical protein
LIAGCDSDDKQKAPAARVDEPGGARSQRISAPAGIAEPRRVEASGETAAKATEKAFGREIRPGQPLVIGAACKHGDCIVRYRSQARGSGVVLSGQDRILRPVFASKGVRSVTLYVHHQSVGTRGKNEAPAFATTVCRRREHPSFAWARIGPSDVLKVCHYTHLAGGALRNQVRRGHLSNKRASQGKGPPGKRGADRN